MSRWALAGKARGSRSSASSACSLAALAAVSAPPWQQAPSRAEPALGSSAESLV